MPGGPMMMPGAPMILPGAPEPVTVMPGGGRIRAAIIAEQMGEPPEAGGVAARLARMTPAEQEAFKRNLLIWQQMPKEQRQFLKEQFNQHKREEVQAALKESGLNLNSDQREIFALRYMQERRKLERDIQDQANAERSRRMPEIIERLRREFGAGKPAPASGAAPGSR